MSTAAATDGEEEEDGADGAVQWALPDGAAPDALEASSTALAHWARKYSSTAASSSPAFNATA